MSLQSFFNVAEMKMDDLAKSILLEVNKKQKDIKFKGMLKAPHQQIDFHKLAIL